MADISITYFLLLNEHVYAASVMNSKRQHNAHKSSASHLLRVILQKTW